MLLQTDMSVEFNLLLDEERQLISIMQMHVYSIKKHKNTKNIWSVSILSVFLRA